MQNILSGMRKRQIKRDQLLQLSNYLLRYYGCLRETNEYLFYLFELS